MMLLQESRRAARNTAEGDLVLLDRQDRGLWNKDQIAEGLSLVERIVITPLRRLHPPSGYSGSARRGSYRGSY